MDEGKIGLFLVFTAYQDDIIARPQMHFQLSKTFAKQAFDTITANTAFDFSTGGYAESIDFPGAAQIMQYHVPADNKSAFVVYTGKLII